MTKLQHLPREVLIVAVPETAGSALYGMLDVLMAAGNVWQTPARTGMEQQLFTVRIIAPTAGTGQNLIQSTNLPLMPNRNSVIIRTATCKDLDDVRDVHLCAFPADERHIISVLAVKLLSGRTIPETISLVAETEGTVAGHAAFSPVTIGHNDNLQGYILAPLGIKPEYQRRRIGTRLIQSGRQKLLSMSVNILFVYGDPGYYRKSGFSADAAAPYIPPYKLRYPSGWQAIVLKECNIAASSFNIACVSPLNNPELW